MLAGSRSTFSTPVWLDGVADVHLAVHQHVVDGQVQLVRVGAEAGGQRALRVEVHQQHAAAVFGERGGKVDGGGGLAHPALLVDHGDDARGAVRWQGGRLRKLASGAGRWGP